MRFFFPVLLALALSIFSKGPAHAVAEAPNIVDTTCEPEVELRSDGCPKSIYGLWRPYDKGSRAIYGKMKICPKSIEFEFQGRIGYKRRKNETGREYISLDAPLVPRRDPWGILISKEFFLKIYYPDTPKYPYEPCLLEIDICETEQDILDMLKGGQDRCSSGGYVPLKTYDTLISK